MFIFKYSIPVIKKGKFTKEFCLVILVLQPQAVTKYIRMAFYTKSFSQIESQTKIYISAQKTAVAECSTCKHINRILAGNLQIIIKLRQCFV